MTDPLFWLVLSLLFVTVSLTIVLVVAIPTLRELARASRSAEKLFDTLRHEFPPTLQAIRLTGLEISDLTDDVSEGVQSAGHVVKQVDQSLTGVRKQAQRVQSSTRILTVGIKAAWRTFTRSPKHPPTRRTVDRFPSPRSDIEFSSPAKESSHNDDLTAQANSPSTSRRLPSDAPRSPSPAPSQQEISGNYGLPASTANTAELSARSPNAPQHRSPTSDAAQNRRPERDRLQTDPEDALREP